MRPAVHLKQRSCVVVATAFLVICGPAGGRAATLYVSPNGSDTGTGLQGDPLRTIQRAADVVNPGDTVIVKDGTYSDRNGDGTIVWIKRGGTADNWVTFRAENKWGAVLDGQNSQTAIGMRIHDPGSYVRVENFEVKDTHEAGINVRKSAHHVVLYGNHIHHIGTVCTEVGIGLNAVFQNANDFTLDSNVIHDIGRLADGENGCHTPQTAADQNNDHGIYVSGSSGHDSILVNNVFWNCYRGWPVHIYNSGTIGNYQISHNTFGFAHPTSDGQIVIAGPIKTLTIQSNIFYEPRNAAIHVFKCNGSSGVVQDNISTIGIVSGGRCLTVGNHNASNTDPRFVDADAYDFHLQASSPAIDAAGAAYAPSVDHDGNLRPQGAGYDIGAYEYHGSSTARGSTGSYSEIAAGGNHGARHRRTRPARLDVTASAGSAEGAAATPRGFTRRVRGS